MAWSPRAPRLAAGWPFHARSIRQGLYVAGSCMTAGAGLTGKDLYPRFSDEEYARRYRAVRNAMQKENLDAILISGARGSSEVHLSFKLFGPVALLAFVSPRRRSDRLYSFLQPSTLRQGAIYYRRCPLVWPLPDRQYRKRNPTERAGRQ